MENQLPPAVWRVLKGRGNRVQHFATPHDLPFDVRGVYMLWRDGRLEYVGCSGRPRMRVTGGGHQYKNKPDRVTFLPVADKPRAFGIERQLIRACRPKYNRVNNPAYHRRAQNARYVANVIRGYLYNGQAAPVTPWTARDVRRLRAEWCATKRVFAKSVFVSVATLRRLEVDGTEDAIQCHRLREWSWRLSELLFAPYIVTGPDRTFERVPSIESKCKETT